ncbi:MAG: hypothetical protein M1829_000060 [Trizodia sp. TS-e1964]|nr:MAG: hypothetical protein M1829_000060 [Trizodia sp. TS-e1964]
MPAGVPCSRGTPIKKLPLPHAKGQPAPDEKNMLPHAYLLPAAALFGAAVATSTSSLSCLGELLVQPAGPLTAESSPECLDIDGNLHSGKPCATFNIFPKRPEDASSREVTIVSYGAEGETEAGILSAPDILKFCLVGYQLNFYCGTRLGRTPPSFEITEDGFLAARGVATWMQVTRAVGGSYFQLTEAGRERIKCRARPVVRVQAEKVGEGVAQRLE